MRWLAFDHLYRGGGSWSSPGWLGLDGAGLIAEVADALPAGAAGEHHSGFAVPGMPNLHSHAFQRALVGRTGVRSASADSFWTWREAMYRAVAELGPDEFEEATAAAYAEMLRAGYTTVAEFHYLHHDRDGGEYADPAELGRRVVAAAARTGIALTCLPVLYAHGGIGEPPRPEQRRFVHRDVDRFLALVERLGAQVPGRPWLRVGIAPHSLRAVARDELAAAVAGVRALDPAAPIHIHAAEQLAEVAACEQRLGARPVRFLLDAVGLDTRWCVVHAIHCDDGELRDLAASGAVAGLCPSTEADLGDGAFRTGDYLGCGGAFGIGTDSQVCVDPATELRLLEYAERLARHERNVLAPPPGAGTVATRLFDAALAGGARAVAQPVGQLAPGVRADVVVLDPEHPRLRGHGPATALDAWVFGHAHGAVRRVLVGGRVVV